ncbi:major facilitator superfamily MFS_1 [Kribbella flavida DSM 17836]|uniref:Multidrug efflux pump Tap n=1 Tax=Kribbella flavida (strain DSM 17836 / JCM 10339 / NBRC 14399) TaxID=479435 RepID=D2PRI7_KRIFD|nr:MFS transporter [Kribbella flavida]ADB34905.1 major facilitator superfamily MFS_1 [Kribbella flavida DSM 17836]
MSNDQPTTTSTPNRAPLIAFLAANVISICGTRVSAIAIPWFVLMSTGSPFKTGVVALAEMLPLVLSKAVGGPLIDRIGPKRVSVGADTASAVVVGLIPLLHTLHLLSFPLLLVIVAVAGALRGPGDAAKGTLVPDIAEAAKTPLERVTGLESTTERLAGLIAFALAGGLIALVGEVNALWIDAASFAVCAILIRRWIPAAHKPAEDAADEGSYGQRLLQGWLFLRGDKLLLALVLMIAVTNLLDAAFAVVMLPVWIRDHGYGPAQIGMVLTAFSVTATAFALLASAVGDKLPRKVVFTVSFLICGAPRFLVMAFDAPLWGLMAVAAVAGVGAGFINPVLGALFIERIPRPLLGRVNSLADAVAWIGVPLGGVVAGAAIAGVGASPALLAAAGVYFVATMSPLLFGRGTHWGGRPARRDRSAPAEGSERPDQTAAASERS